MKLNYLQKYFIWYYLNYNDVYSEIEKQGLFKEDWFIELDKSKEDEYFKYVFRTSYYRFDLLSKELVKKVKEITQLWKRLTCLRF